MKHTHITFGIFAICFSLMLAARTPAQSTDHPSAADWGKSVQGVQLSIRMTTSVFQVGASATVESVTKNSATNDIVVDTFAPTVVFDVLLTNSAGSTYHVTTPMPIRGPRHFVTLKPGEESSESIPVTFGKTRFGDTVEPGDYTLLATRHFGLSMEDMIHPGGRQFVLESNSLKVQIKERL